MNSSPRVYYTGIKLSTGAAPRVEADGLSYSFIAISNILFIGLASLPIALLQVDNNNTHEDSCSIDFFELDIVQSTGETCADETAA